MLRVEEDAATSGKLEHRYGMFIKASPEQIWDALTTPAQTAKFYFGSAVESDWEVGSPVAIMTGDRSMVLFSGKVLESQSARRLLHTVDVKVDPALANKGEITIGWSIDPMGEVSLVTMTHSATEPDRDVFELLCASSSMPMLSALKTLLETGEPLELGTRPPAMDERAM
jgi:uncharacterized protein YndB with AHSA1/START domain